ncbi:DUF397 domain-containing protein [Streptomyces bobili]|uniref:DUF397 domain-containing protein n=1 Tax=Streptomyces TaxID=1883 RepID=UPI0022588AC0|nr:MULTISPECIES: DUF397 domain-containing protein [Streptomyces]MCX5525516.1 DUF397 domain-containing protein [Streptomyces bobili]MDX3572745.1 DUF397 domain-containing protein [Streptomyces sp. ID05-47C]
MRTLEIQWRKSSYSEQSGNCLELAVVDGQVLVRESDDPGVIVCTTSAKLAAFLAGAKAGEFDDLV